MFQQNGFESINKPASEDAIIVSNFKNKWFRGLAEQILVNYHAISHDCNIIFMPATFGLLFPLRKCVTFVHTNTAFILEPHLRGRSRLQQLAHNILSKITYYTSSSLVFTSETTRQEYFQYLGQEPKGEIIGNGFSWDRTTPLRIKANRSSENFILCVGQIYRLKNFHLVADALTILKRQDPYWHDFRLKIVGTIQEDDYINELLQFSFVDHYQDLNNEQINQLYGDANYFVNPSLFEGFSMTVAEALISSNVVLISNIPTHVEIYNDEHVYFFDPRSAQDLAHLLQISRDKQPKLISNDFKQRFSHSEFQRKLAVAFDEI